MKHVTVALFFLMLLLPAVSATQLQGEELRFDVSGEGPANATVTRHYDTITSDKLSYLVPSKYDPRQLQAWDEQGRLDCTVETLDIGKELLCDPRERKDYTVNIRYFGDFTTRQEDRFTFSYVKQVLTPTKNVRMRVVLPEGYGLQQSSDSPYVPPAAVDTEGRRIFVHWQDTSPSIGDTTHYTVRYEKLGALERMSPGTAAGIAVIALLVVAGTGLYLRRNDNGSQSADTIAAIFPVLKEDEQLVLRYLIDNDGEAEQRDIVQNVDYSKAKISKLLSDLEDRSLVEKQKQGRVNIVTLARDVGELNGDS